MAILSSCSDMDTVKSNYTFEAAINPTVSIQEYDEADFESFENLNLGFFKGELWLKLDITNVESENKSFMFISNDRFNRNYTFYKLDKNHNELKLLNKISDSSIQDHRTFNNPNANFKIDLTANEEATYLITTSSDGRTKDATPRISSLESYFDYISESTTWNITFYGIFVFLLLINLYQWSIYKQKIYFYYVVYIVSTILVYLGIEGYLITFRIEQNYIDHFVFVSVKLWAFSLIMYTSKFLEIETLSPKYYKLTKYILWIVLGGILVYQFTFYKTSIQYLHYFENILASLWLLIIAGMIIIAARTKREELKYYLTPLACFILLTVIGLINVHFQILPGNSFTYVKLGGIVELTGFTYFMTLLIKKKLRKAELLENELLENKKQLQVTSKELKDKESELASQPNIDKTDLLAIFKLLENSLVTEKEWEEFKTKFNELNPKFIEHLLANHPNLTKSEIRLLTLIKIGYSQKEIAVILNIAPDSVKKARTRVRKKLNLEQNDDLNSYLKTL